MKVQIFTSRLSIAKITQLAPSITGSAGQNPFWNRFLLSAILGGSTRLNRTLLQLREWSHPVKIESLGVAFASRESDLSNGVYVW